jgi:steroid delta-isomerase-like uncharacterized protein
LRHEAQVNSEAPAKSAAQTMSNAEHMPLNSTPVSSSEHLVRRHLAAENAHDMDGTLATLHPDCVFRDHATGQIWHGHSGAADHYRHWWRTFDVAVERGEGQRSFWSAEGTYVAQATWRGSHIGDFLGIRATSLPIVQPFVVFVTFKQGLMAGEEFFYDLASLLRQLGVDRLPELTALAHRAIGHHHGSAAV